MLEEHREQMKIYEKMPYGKLMFAMAVLSDVIDGDMKGEEMQVHVNDAKEMIADSVKEMVDFDAAAGPALALLEKPTIVRRGMNWLRSELEALEVAKIALRLRTVRLAGVEVAMLSGGFAEALQKLEKAPVSAWSGDELDALEIAKGLLKKHVPEDMLKQLREM